MKKVLSLVLVIAMVLSSMSFALASPMTDIADTNYTKAIETLVGLGVVSGYEDGTFRPEKTITRAEMAKMMVVTLGYGDLVAGSKSNFSDTQGHWADAYIALAAGKGIVVGTGDGKFAPDRTVSYNEAITMLVRGLGYTDTCNELKGMSWPTNFKVKAAELDITDDVAMSNNGADRGGVAQLIYNALDSALVSVDSDGNVVFFKDSDDGNKLLLSRLGDKVTVKITPDSLDEDNDDYLGAIIDLSSYMYQTLTVYENDDEYVVYVKSSDSVVIEGTVDSVDKANDKFVVEDADDDDYTIDLADSIINGDKVNVFYNGDEFEATIDDIKDTFESITVVGFEDEKDDNGKIDKNNELIGLVVTNATDVVRVEKEYVTGKTKLDGLALPTDDDDVDLDNITVTGEVSSLEDIKEDDIVVQYSSDENDVTKLVVTRNTLNGKVTRVKDSNTFLVDGESYDTADLYLGVELVLGSEGVFYLDNNGDIADFDGEADGPTDYAVVVGSDDGSIDEKFGFSIDTYPQLKLATQGNEEIVYEVALEIDSDDKEVDSSADYKVGKNTVELFKTADVEFKKDGKIDIETTFIDGTDYLVKYSLDKNGRIDELELVETLGTGDYANSYDLEKSTNRLVDDAVIFDAGDSYSVANFDDLPTDVLAYVVRDDNGKIEVLIAKDGQVDEATDTIFAYIYDVDKTYNSSDEKVQLAGVYTDNADSRVYTTDDTTITFGDEGVFAIKYDGEAIDTATSTIATYNVAADGKITAGLLAGDVVTASAVNAKGEMIKVNGTWYAMSENATVVDLDLNKTVWEEDGLADLYDIDEDKTELKVYINADGEIDLILIQD